jgi:methyl-accepting chemotaxis protein
VANPKRTARKAVGLARSTADRTRAVGETMVGASEAVQKALDAVETIVSKSKRRGGRTKKSGAVK